MIPIWNHCSHLGQFLGFSNGNSSFVANVRKFQTGYISPQYHVIFDDLFQIIFSSGKTDDFVDSIYKHLFEDNHDWYAE